MVTRRKDTSSAPAGGRRTTPAASRASSSGPVRVWSEASVTVAITQDPPQFAKFTHGFERMAPNDSPAAVKKVEAEIFAECERIIDLRIKKLRRLMRQIGR